MLRSTPRTTAAWLRAVAAFVFMLALLAAPAHASSVTDCGDTGDATESLRVKVAAAADGEIIDVSQCSTITLLQPVQISTALNLTIQGPADGLTTIDANMNGRAFIDTGADKTLTLSHLLIEHGRVPGGDPNGYSGGCVFAANQVNLQNSILSDCAATTNNDTARGGAVYAPLVQLISSVVLDSMASSANLDAQGGGVWAGTTFTCTKSLLQGNQAIAGDFLNGHAYGGGVYANGTNMNGCAFVGNHADTTGGGIWAFNVFLVNSTVSGNSATSFVGGIAGANYAAITNSTIAFNHGGTCGGVFAPSSSYINSSILANNAAADPTSCHNVNSGFSGGTNNLVDVPEDGVTLPGDTHIGDPQLTPLGNHGGPTPTHALASTSYAVDHGNNGNTLDTDQRGSGFARVVGTNADIGAYERQLMDDEIFYNGME